LKPAERLYQGFTEAFRSPRFALPAANSPAVILRRHNESTDRRSEDMIKIAAIIGGVLLMAGVALAGTMTSLDSTNSPTIGITPPPATSTERQEDRGLEIEQRGRENEPGEDLRGPCDEAEHANDPRCTGTPAAGDDNDADDRRDDDSTRRSSGPGPSSGPDDRSGHDGGHEDNSGPGGGGDD
jgi:hypothetical protein